MRKQAQQWEKALDLACALDPSQVGPLSLLQAEVCGPPRRAGKRGIL